MTRINDRYRDGIVISTSSSYDYMIAIDHYHDKPPSMMDV